jgi:uncharacterized protein YjbI with pentapeptide repeats
MKLQGADHMAEPEILDVQKTEEIDRAIGASFRGKDLSGADLRGKDLSQADLRDCRLVGANLEGAQLHGAWLERAELLNCNLRNADLSSIKAEQAGFSRADLEGAQLFDANLKNASLVEANLRGADLRRACLEGAHLRTANLCGADLQRANLSEADLSGTDVHGAHFDGADLRKSRLSVILNFKHATWIGVDLRGMDVNGAHLLRQHVLDENYLHEFRMQSRIHEWIYRVWWVTSDCGRSFLRWGLWTALLVSVFAGIYSIVDVDFGEHETYISPLYYSVVTLTSLGYGDVLPTSPAAQLAAMIEVIWGYVMLGGLLSIFATKMARRAG